MISVIANILIIIGLIIIFLACINFAKTKNLFASIHFLMISNLYGMSFLFLGLGITNFNSAVIIKILALILLNIIITILITHSISKKAIINNISLDAKLEKLDPLSKNEPEREIL